MRPKSILVNPTGCKLPALAYWSALLAWGADALAEPARRVFEAGGTGRGVFIDEVVDRR